MKPNFFSLKLIVIVTLAAYVNVACSDVDSSSITEPPVVSQYSEAYRFDEMGEPALLKARVAAIENNLPNYKRVERDSFEFSSEGAEVSFYLDKTQVRALTMTIYGETGQTTLEYFCDENSKPFLVRETTHLYEQPFGDTIEKQIIEKQISEVVLHEYTDTVDSPDTEAGVSLSNQPSQRTRAEMLEIYNQAVKTLVQDALSE